MEQRWVPVDGLCNVRDLGGVPLPDGGETAFGVILRSETLAHLTPRGAEDLHRLDVRHVIDLREFDEREADGDGPLSALYQRSAILHENVPLSRRAVDDDVVGRTVEPGLIADRYRDYLDNGGFRLAEAIGRTAWSRSATLVHCAAGKDRTGVVSALLLKLAGADDDAVVADHVMSRESLVHVLNRLAGRATYAHLAEPDWSAQAPSAEAMRLFLCHLAARGGARAWLMEQFVEPETLDLLQQRLRGDRVRALSAG